MHIDDRDKPLLNGMVFEGIGIVFMNDRVVHMAFTAKLAGRGIESLYGILRNNERFAKKAGLSQPSFGTQSKLAYFTDGKTGILAGFREVAMFRLMEVFMWDVSSIDRIKTAVSGSR